MRGARQRVRQAAQNRLAARKEAADRVADAARKAKEGALPRWDQLRHGARRWVSVNPEVAEKVTEALLMAAAGAAAKHSGKVHPAGKMAGPAIAAVGPIVATRAAVKVRRGFEKISVRDDPAEAEAEAAPPEAAVASPAAQASDAAPETTAAGDHADRLGNRPPPDPEALYREGAGSLELAYPLPGDLASLPWNSLTPRNRFFVLVGAWALRETAGIQAFRAGDFGPADEIFQECLIRAQQMQVPELIARSYEDLGELAAERARREQQN